MATAMATAGLNLQVTVHCEEPGTLFVKIMEQIEEVGELTDISELTLSGQLNLDDYNVISNQLSFPQAVTKVGYQAHPDFSVADLHRPCMTA